MVFEPSKDGNGITPMQIAHNSLFTAKEKIELLQKLKAEATGGAVSESGVGFSAEEIDEAIEEVRIGVQQGNPEDAFREAINGNN